MQYGFFLESIAKLCYIEYMHLYLKVSLLTIIVAIIAFFAEPLIWPIDPLNPTIQSTLAPYRFLSILESIMLGLGVSFLLFAWPLFRKIHAESTFLAIGTYISIGWLLSSWWVHDNLHFYAGMDKQSQLYIEYVFHIPLMIAIVFVTYSFLELAIKSLNHRI